MARYVAKHIVAVGLAQSCEVQVAYSIGVAEPVSIMVNTFGTGLLPDAQLETLVREHFDMTPYGITTTLNLLRPIYRPSSCYGHFGREDCALPWESLDQLEKLRSDSRVAAVLATSA